LFSPAETTLVLGSTQPSIQKVPVTLYPSGGEVKRPVREADHLHPSTSYAKNVCGALPPIPTRFHGVHRHFSVCSEIEQTVWTKLRSRREKILQAYFHTNPNVGH